MTIDDEAKDLGRWLKIGAFALVFFVISAFKSCSEIRYMIGGATTPAEITGASEHSGIGRRSRPTVDVSYRFEAKDGKPYTGTTTITASNWVDPVDGKLPVTYLKSDPNVSTLSMQRSKVWFFILLVIVGFVAFNAWKLWQEVEADTAKDRKYRRTA